MVGESDFDYLLVPGPGKTSKKQKQERIEKQEKLESILSVERRGPILKEDIAYLTGYEESRVPNLFPPGYRFELELFFPDNKPTKYSFVGLREHMPGSKTEYFLKNPYIPKK